MPSSSHVRRLRSLLYAVLLALLVLPAVSTAAAQGFAGLDDVDVTGMSYHRFVRPGEATVEVLMLGNTGESGVYVVGVGTGLPEFLALSGVSLGSSGGDEKSKVTVRLYRQQGTNRELVYEAPFEEVYTAPAHLPAFRDGDILSVETVARSPIRWLEVIRTAANFATLAFVIQRLVTGTR